MKLEEGLDSLTTWMGLLCSVLVIAIMLTYSIIKTDIFLSGEDFQILSIAGQSELPKDFVMSYDQGLNFALAFAAYSTDLGPELVPSIAHLAFEAKEWYYDKELDRFVIQRVPLETHPCTR